MMSNIKVLLSYFYRDDNYDKEIKELITRHVLMGQIPSQQHPSIMDNNCVKYYLHPSFQVTCQRLWPRNKFSLCVNCDLDLGDMTLSESHNTIVLNIIQIKHDSKELWV